MELKNLNDYLDFFLNEIKNKAPFNLKHEC